MKGLVRPLLGILVLGALVVSGVFMIKRAHAERSASAKTMQPTRMPLLEARTLALSVALRANLILQYQAELAKVTAPHQAEIDRICKAYGLDPEKLSRTEGVDPATGEIVRGKPGPVEQAALAPPKGPSTAPTKVAAKGEAPRAPQAQAGGGGR